MKRIINCATKKQLNSRIIDGFINNGCSNVKISEQSKANCIVHLTLPSGLSTELTVWYDSKYVKNGSRPKTRLVKWNSYYTIDSDGSVYDENGDHVGEAYVRISDGTATANKRSYNIDSIRTNSADILIDHLRSSRDFSNVIKSLDSRTVTIRS